jgi:hypothetical protein
MMVAMSGRRSWGVALAALLVLGSCGDSIREVPTNGGGILDCPSDTVLYAVVDPTPEAGAPTPAEALAALTSASVPPVPSGIPEVASESDHEVAYLFTNSDGHRVGRVIVRRPFEAGWSVVATERCG